MLEHKISVTVEGVGQVTNEVVTIFRTLASNISRKEKVTALNESQERCVRIASNYGTMMLAKEVVAAGFAIAAKSGGILSFLGVVGSTIMNSFLFMIIGMFMKGVIAAGIIIALFTKIVSYFTA